MLPGEANIVVIGGGVFGTSIAFHLAAAGHQDIVLFDRGPIAGGTTPFAAGQTAALPNKKSQLPFATYCIEFFERFAENTGYPIDFRQNGSLRIALTEQYLPKLEARLEIAKSAGNKVELITPHQAKELVPALEVPEAKGILFIPRDGYVEPRSVAAAFAAAAQSRGVAIYTRTPVVGVDLEDGEVRSVRTINGALRTKWVVLAAGAWTRQFGQYLGVHTKVVPVRHQAFVTAPLPVVTEKQPIVRIVEPQIYVRPEAGGLLVGGYGYRPLSFDMNAFPDRFEITDLEADQIYYTQLAEAAASFFPVLRKAVIIQERRGLPTITPDAQLVVSELEQIKGLIVASGCMVGGIFASPGVGRVVADIVSGKESRLPAAELKAERFAAEYAQDARLRARCEQVYASHYWDVY